MRNIDYAIRKTAIDLNIENKSEEVKTVIMRYWKEVRDKTVYNKMELDKTTLFLRGIGIFTISHYKLNKFILKLISKIRGMNRSVKYTEEVKQSHTLKLMNRLKKALVHRNILAIYYAKYYKNI